MPKYYVSTGGLTAVLSRRSARQAALDALASDFLAGADPDRYGSVTEVSETGYAPNPTAGVFFSTPALLEHVVNMNL